MDKIDKKEMDMVYRVCFRVLNNEEMAKDCMQTTYYKMYSKKGFKGNSSRTTYLYRIAYNTAIDMIRKNKNHSDAPIDTLIHYKGREDKIELKVIMESLIDKLPERQKEIILMRFYADYSIKEIANKLDLSEGTVKSNIFFAIENLRKIIGGEKNEMR